MSHHATDANIKEPDIDLNVLLTYRWISSLLVIA